MDKLSDWPIAVIEDRYGGTYSKDQWLAISQDDMPEDGFCRVSYCLAEGPHGGDMEAHAFWLEPPAWIAVGPTPEAAIAALKAKRS